MSYLVLFLIVPHAVMSRAQRIVIQLSLQMKVDGIYEMLDDDVRPISEHVEATTTQIISYRPRCKLSRGDDIYSIKDDYEMVQDTKNCLHTACF